MEEWSGLLQVRLKEHQRWVGSLDWQPARIVVEYKWEEWSGLLQARQEIATENQQRARSLGWQPVQTCW